MTTSNNMSNMPRNKEYENKIPAFYRKSVLDLMLFTHATAVREFQGTDDNGKYLMTVEQAVQNFFDTYCISDNEFPMESALTTYTRMRHNFIWSEMKRNIDNSNK